MIDNRHGEAIFFGKVCLNCRKQKVIEDFHTDPDSEDGYAEICNDCFNELISREQFKVKENPELDNFDDLALMKELRSRGFKGAITKFYTFEI